jgi:hypothetical protein
MDGCTLTRMLVCGDRNWLDRRFPDGTENEDLKWWVHDQTLDVLLDLAKAYRVDTVIEGCARGADRCAEDFSAKFPILITNHLHFPAEWDKYRKPGGKNPAGPIRNMQMLEEGKPDFVVAFHDNLLESKGTRHMVRIADDAGIDVYGYSTGTLVERSVGKRADS